MYINGQTKSLPSHKRQLDHALAFPPDEIIRSRLDVVSASISLHNRPEVGIQCARVAIGPCALGPNEAASCSDCEVILESVICTHELTTKSALSVC